MKKRWLVPVLIALLAVLPVTVHAEHFTGGDGWKVSFNGKKMTSTFKNTDIDDAVYKLEPGDDVTFSLALRNDYSKTTDWYMTNKVLQSLEDTQSVAEGGAYSYILTYCQPDGTEQILYSSDQVGGETKNESGEGLHQATNSLKDYFYLDRLQAGEAGTITLQVELEGETQGNTYQDTLAKLQMNFAVELVNESTTPSSDHSKDSDTEQGKDNDSKHTSGDTTQKTRPVKTGDNSQVILYSVLMFLSGLFCVGMVVYSIRNRRKIQEDDAGGKGKA